jgi:hypothetical protein
MTLAGMKEDDKAIVLKVFAAAQLRYGPPGQDDRRFLEALHFFTSHNPNMARAACHVRAAEQHLEKVPATQPFVPVVSSAFNPFVVA